MKSRDLPGNPATGLREAATSVARMCGLLETPAVSPEDSRAAIVLRRSGNGGLLIKANDRRRLCRPRQSVAPRRLTVASEQATTDIGSLDFFHQGVDDGVYRRIGIRAAVFDR